MSKEAPPSSHPSLGPAGLHWLMKLELLPAFGDSTGQRYLSAQQAKVKVKVEGNTTHIHCLPALVIYAYLISITIYNSHYYTILQMGKLRLRVKKLVQVHRVRDGTTMYRKI